MMIELLRFTVAPDQRDAFIARDAEVWTPVLAARPGFLGKMALADRDDPSQVVLITRWESVEHWQAFPDDLRQALDAQMRDLYAGFSLEAHDVRRSTQSI
jgi:uncharacterized protein (TIGR03792 family)